MDRKIAIEIMDGIERINSILNDAGHLCDGILDPELKVEIKKKLGLAMGRIYIDLMRPVCEIYPELSPD